MERLPRRDVQPLHEFLRESYASLDLPVFGRHVLLGLARLVPCDIIGYHELDTRAGRLTRQWHPPEADFPGSQAVYERHLSEHPIVTYRIRSMDGQALQLSDFVTRPQFHRLGIYNEFYRRLGIEHLISIMIPAQPSVLIGIPLNRARRDFGERDRLLLNLVRPHLIQAYRNAEAVTEIGQDLSALGQMGEFGRAVIVTGQGRVRVMTTRARQWLAEYFGVPSRGGDRLPEGLQQWVRHQEAHLAGNPDDVASPLKPLIVDRGGKRLVVRLASDPPRSLLLFEEQQTTSEPAALKSLGLSRREAEVLAWVAQGKTNAEIGKILSSSPRTVEKHLEHVFEKLGVESRTAAAKVALSPSPPS